MDKNKIITILFWLAIVGSVLFGIYRFFIARNFLLVYQTECDPTMEKCFVWQCDETLGECTGNEEEDVWYYSKVKKMAYDTAKCNPKNEECPDESTCDQPIAQKCWIEKCDENNLEEGEKCIDPETYLMQHPEALEEEADEENAEEEESETETVESESEGETEAAEEVPTEESPENLTPDENSAAAQPASTPESPSTEKTETVVPY